MGLAVSVQNLGKAYRIEPTDRSGGSTYRTIREEIAAVAAYPLGWLRGAARSDRREPFWALKDVSFNVQSGEVLGVIGRNGAGKSTLLKLLSRVTRPTTGEARMRGRVGSLLEVGTGFHPELTGRENVFLNGAILGMSRQEIGNKFDEIVAFAEVGQFLDTPVKRYSSGMYVRLAFAVAAFLEPETLIIDEALAVGDLGFQRKCLGRIREVGRSGRTVLFVSHNMAAVESLCTRAILLDGGQIVGMGEVRPLIQEYQRRVAGPSAINGETIGEMGGPNRRHRVFRSLRIIDDDSQPTATVRMGGRLHLRIGLLASRPVDSPTITVGINDTYGHRLLTLCTPLSAPVATSIEGEMSLECIVECLPLAPGDYWLKLGLASPGEEIDEIEQVMRFVVTDCDAFGEGRGFRTGTCVAASCWRVL